MADGLILNHRKYRGRCKNCSSTDTILQQCCFNCHCIDFYANIKYNEINDDDPLLCSNTDALSWKEGSLVVEKCSGDSKDSQCDPDEWKDGCMDDKRDLWTPEDDLITDDSGLWEDLSQNVIGDGKNLSLNEDSVKDLETLEDSETVKGLIGHGLWKKINENSYYQK